MEPSTNTTPSPPKQPTQQITFAFAKRHGVLLTALDDTHAKIIYKPGVRIQTLQELRRYFAKPLVLEEVTEELFSHLLTKLYKQKSSEEMLLPEIEMEGSLSDLTTNLPKTEDLLDSSDDAPMIRLLNGILSEAIKKDSSDIHIETYEDRLVIRLRIDGVLREVLRLQPQVSPLLISRVKVMAKLDIAEKRVPQDGRIALLIAGQAVDVRVSTMPASHGERVVMRLLDKQAGSINLDKLGLLAEEQKKFDKLIRQPHGIILVTGPTGSGKSTTLYAALTQLNDETRNILTVEDPVEYYIPGIGQTQVNTKVDMTFARGLRAILRQDPDIVMIGEIRDLETAQIAVQASLTGHLVLSTLHTNTAIGAITRLRDIGVEHFLLSSTVIGVMAQRLVRVLCPKCKEAYQADEETRKLLDIDSNNNPTIYRAVGCKACNETGYQGRLGLFELIVIDDTLRHMIQQNESELTMEKHAHEHAVSLRNDGRQKVLDGITTVEELLRVTREE